MTRQQEKQEKERKKKKKEEEEEEEEERERGSENPPGRGFAQLFNALLATHTAP